MNDSTTAILVAFGVAAGMILIGNAAGAAPKPKTVVELEHNGKRYRVSKLSDGRSFRVEQGSNILTFDAVSGNYHCDGDCEQIKKDIYEFPSDLFNG